LKFAKHAHLPKRRLPQQLERFEDDQSSAKILDFKPSPERETVTRIARSIVTSRSKRTLDVAIAGSLIILLLPAFVAIAVAIKISSRGPVLFRQHRYGVHRQIFLIWKFRTMRVMEAHGSFVQASANDDRVTPVGAWLRKSSLDELPQLFNVIGGSMSLVGPRPHAVAMDDHFAQTIPTLPARHLVRPGMTGLAQVRGFRGPTVERSAIEGRVACDLDYICNWWIGTDIAILFKTPIALMRDKAF
jgi:putative colanic acid biosysnthesis UDP-glucose lipid carrier transferase